MNITSSEIIENNNSKTINRVSTKDEWALVNPVLQIGELGFEKDGQMINIKMGNGVTHWNALPYISKQCPYDVGDIFYTENETHPSVRWPGTEWEALPGGHCLVAAGTNPETGTIFQAGETGGEEKHQLTIGELPAHSHTRGTMEITGALTERPSSSVEIIRDEDLISPNAFSSKCPDTLKQWGVNVPTSGSSTRKNNTIYFTASKSWTGSTSEVGNGQDMCIIQPFFACYFWKRKL